MPNYRRAWHPGGPYFFTVERGIWQRRYSEHSIRDEKDFAAHRDYVHSYPLQHGLVNRVVDWPYSTPHRLS